eukprot:1161480-Pelagomonas_calceolata.AAC.19
MLPLWLLRGDVYNSTVKAVPWPTSMTSGRAWHVQSTVRVVYRAWPGRLRSGSSLFEQSTELNGADECCLAWCLQGKFRPGKLEVRNEEPAVLESEFAPLMSSTMRRRRASSCLPAVGSLLLICRQ